MNSLKFFRLFELGMTQKQLGAKLDLTQAQISQIEKGLRGKQFKPEKMQILRDMGYKEEVTNSIDINKIFTTKQNDNNESFDEKVSKLNKSDYKNDMDYLKDFLGIFFIDLFVGANQFGDVSLQLLYKGKDIYTAKHKNGCSISTK